MKKRISVFAIWATLFVMVAGTAVAVEGDMGEEESTETPQSVITPSWDDEFGVVIVTIGDGETDPCEGVTWMRDLETDVLTIYVDDVSLEDGAELPPGCIVQDGTGPNGQRNHGSMVSAVARNISPHDLDVPKGWIMRELAKFKVDKVKPPKGDDPDDGEDDDGEKPAKVKKDKKAKKDKPEKPAKVKKDKKAKKDK